MKQIGVEELRKLQLQILEEVDGFCEKNHINYWIDYGTLLGSVRHAGYIPWDDDIDIGMLRADYEQFRELFCTTASRYKLFCPEKDEGFFAACSKVCDLNTVMYEPNIHGVKSYVNIDIFVYDDAPRDEKKIRELYRRVHWDLLLHMLQHGMISDRGNRKRRMFLHMAKALLHLVPRKYFLKRIVNNACREKKVDPEKVGMFGWDAYLLIEKRILTDTVKIPFENRWFRAPRDYGALLEQEYGDYMMLPPVEKQVSHHCFEAYVLENESESCP